MKSIINKVFKYRVWPKASSFALCLIICTAGLAQTRPGESKEMGYQIGTSFYLGDLNRSNPFGGRMSVAQGGYFRHNFNSRIGLRFQYMQGEIEAWDSDSKNPWAVNRNLHFRNKIVEVSVSGEINYIDHVIGNSDQRLTGYLTAGLAFYTHDPEALDSYGNWQPLNPLGTEGQGWVFGVDPYKLNGIALPFGMGFKLNMGPAMSFQMEWGLRKTWTDYLDDVSTSYTNGVDLRQARGSLALEMADRIIELPTGLDNSEGLQRGDPGKDDRYGYFLASLVFRVSKKPTSCWEQ